MKATYNTIDWEYRRYEIAKEMMAAFLSNSSREAFADALIEELRKGGSND